MGEKGLAGNVKKLALEKVFELPSVKAVSTGGMMMTRP